VAYIKVITAPPLGDVLVSAGQIPLPAVGTAIVARRGSGEQAIHGEEAAAHIVDTNVTAKAELLQLPLVGTEALRSTAHRIVRWMVVVENIIGVSAELRCEVLGGHRAVHRMPIAVQPGPVAWEWRFFGKSFGADLWWGGRRCGGWNRRRSN